MAKKVAVAQVVSCGNCLSTAKEVPIAALLYNNFSLCCFNSDWSNISLPYANQNCATEPRANEANWKAELSVPIFENLSVGGSAPLEWMTLLKTVIIVMPLLPLKTFSYFSFQNIKNSNCLARESMRAWEKERERDREREREWVENQSTFVATFAPKKWPKFFKKVSFRKFCCPRFLSQHNALTFEQFVSNLVPQQSHFYLTENNKWLNTGSDLGQKQLDFG